jgi:nitrogen-specific signal transduction histidine kinase
MSSEELEKLIHDVNSKCASMRDAAPLLRDAAPAEARELLTLMVEQARSLTDVLVEFGRLDPGR